MSHLRINPCDDLSNFANRRVVQFPPWIARARPKAPTRYEIVDSKLKEETADRAYCDTACAEEGTQTPSLPRTPSRLRHAPLFLLIGTRVAPCTLDLGNCRLRRC